MSKRMPGLQRVLMAILMAFSVVVAAGPSFAQAQQNYPNKPGCLNRWKYLHL